MPVPGAIASAHSVGDRELRAGRVEVARAQLDHRERRVQHCELGMARAEAGFELGDAGAQQRARVVETATTERDVGQVVAGSRAIPRARGRVAERSDRALAGLPRPVELAAGVVHQHGGAIDRPRLCGRGALGGRARVVQPGPCALGSPRIAYARASTVAASVAAASSPLATAASQAGSASRAASTGSPRVSAIAARSTHSDARPDPGSASA